MASTTTVVGNLAQEIELKYTQSGKAVCNVTVAVNDKKFNRQTGQYEDGPTWFARGTLWGELAEHVAQSLGKGSRVIGFGRIGQREFEAKSGEKRTTVEIEFDAFGPDLRWATAQVTRAQGAQNAHGASGASSGAGWHNPSLSDSQGFTEPSSGGFGDWDEGRPF